MPPEDSETIFTDGVAVTTVTGKIAEEKHKFQPRAELTSFQLLFVRVCYISAIVCCYRKSDVIQTAIDALWTFIKDEWWFRTVYFETLLVIILGVPSTTVYYIMDFIPILDKYRISNVGGKFIVDRHIVHVLHAFEYFIPLGLLDTFHVKHYRDVSDDVIADKRKHWIQTTRAFPENAPQFGDMVRHILVAVIIYDALFFVLHYSLHKSQTLYRIFHKKHHTHTFINAKATDHQNWIERVAFILLANAGLKIQGAHPLTRMMFAIVLVCILLYNHGGYDFPWMPDRIIPGDILCGSSQHYKHHASGERNYQFILTYLDNGLTWLTSRRKNLKDA